MAVLEHAAISILADDLDPAISDAAVREAHKLSGSLGTFGLPEGSEVAREIESWFRTHPVADPAGILRLSDLVVALRRYVDAGPTPAVGIDSRRTSDHDARVLLLVDDDPMLINDLSREATARGFELVATPDVASARAIIATRRPEAVLIDLAGADPDHTFPLMRELNDHLPPVPVVVLTHRGAFSDRVEAARLGGRGFVQTSLPPTAILDAVGDTLARVRAREATVLVVDDDPALLGLVSTLLARGGLRVVTLLQPLRFWEVLSGTAPDLVVLDVDMPDVNGVELCQAMRADQRWSDLPVLFLTARTDAATVEAIFAAGADDYVAKPIVGSELSTRIANRLERSRLMRRMVETDALTGVANHRTSAAGMEQLLARSRRLADPMAFAMIDVDGLKLVNDRLGYEAGDEILAALGRLLQRSFRGDDVVGRWAGQEFFVGMYGMTRGDGVERLAGVLEDFRRKTFADGHGGSLRASFSAGVAEHPGDGTDLPSLYRRADMAVRRAKETGGDRVTPAGRPAEQATTDVAVVEDDEALAAILLHGLGTRAYRTEHFADGQDAADALQGPDPRVLARVILLDWGLPSLDGLRVLRRLADSGVLARTRVIMLTARDTESEVLQALDLGAFDHVAKPFSVAVLMKKVHRALES